MLLNKRENMRTMKCNQLGGACEKEFSASTFDEIAQMSQKHGKEMFEKNDKAHIEAMNKMKTIMQKPEDMQKWIDAKKKEFDALEALCNKHKN